jgi:D-amino-acid dehydrogenase
VKRIVAENGKVAAVETDKGRIAADAVVVCLANDAPPVLRPLGLKLPIYPVKGYSLTLPVGEGHLAPQLPGVDENYLVAFARMGDRLRLTATADFAGFDKRHKPSDFEPMLKVARDLFPNGADYSKPDYFACLRPMTPDGPPVIGKGGIEGLWINTGHGHIGWTMACGSSRVLAELVAGRRSPVPLDGLEPQRYAA